MSVKGKQEVQQRIGSDDENISSDEDIEKLEIPGRLRKKNFIVSFWKLILSSIDIQVMEPDDENEAASEESSLVREGDDDRQEPEGDSVKAIVETEKMEKAKTTISPKSQDLVPVCSDESVSFIFFLQFVLKFEVIAR